VGCGAGTAAGPHSLGPRAALYPESHSRVWRNW
jgi:hypothetical protein